MYDSSRDDDSTEAEYANWEPHLQNQNEQGRQPSGSRSRGMKEPLAAPEPRVVDPWSNPTVGGDGRRSRYSRLLAVFAVCVALLCVLLLSFTIVQSVKLNNMTGERDEWKISYYKVSVKRDQLHSERNKLQAERDQLQSERDQLQSERDQLQGERDQLQSERDELQKWSKMWNYTIHHSLKYFTTNETSWSKAREECRSKGADLVIINSREEQEYISGVFAGEAWIGLHDTVQEGKWMWVDGTEVTTKFWRKGEPNIYGGIEDCAATGSKYAKAELTTWADYSCETVFQAICEKRANI